MGHEFRLVPDLPEISSIKKDLVSNPVWCEAEINILTLYTGSITCYGSSHQFHVYDIMKTSWSYFKIPIQEKKTRKENIKKYKYSTNYK